MDETSIGRGGEWEQGVSSWPERLDRRPGEDLRGLWAWKENSGAIFMVSWAVQTGRGTEEWRKPSKRGQTPSGCVTSALIEAGVHFCGRELG